MILAEHQQMVQDFNANILHYYVQFEMQLLAYYRLRMQPVPNEQLLEENLVKQYALLEAIELMDTAHTRSKLSNIEKKILTFFIERKTSFIEEPLLPEIALFMGNKYGRFIDARQVVDKEEMQETLLRHDQQGEIAQYLSQYRQFLVQWPFEQGMIAQESRPVQLKYVQALRYLLAALHAEADIDHVQVVCEKLGVQLPQEALFYGDDVRELVKEIGTKGATSLLLDVLVLHRFIVTDEVLNKSLFQLVHLLGLMKQHIERLVAISNAVKLAQYELADLLAYQMGNFPQLAAYVSNYRIYGGDMYRPLHKVLVIGTMSSGKSTFLNGIIGKDLFPSKNEACTAKIFEYTCRTDLEHYYAKHDLTANYERYDNLNEDSFAEWNARDELQHIQIQGPITSVYRFAKRLMFLDTPGPNNSMDASHAAMMDKALLLPFQQIVYVINGTQLATDDDRFLLVKIAEHLKNNPHLQLLFIVNKVDEFDNNENESVQTLKDNVFAYLAANGFDAPRVVFTSALACKLVLKQLAGEVLTRRERNLLTFYEELFVTQGINFEQLSTPISVHAQNTVHYNLPNASEQEVAIAQKIIQHSGILHALRSI